MAKKYLTFIIAALKVQKFQKPKCVLFFETPCSMRAKNQCKRPGISCDLIFVWSLYFLVLASCPTMETLIFLKCGGIKMLVLLYCPCMETLDLMYLPGMETLVMLCCPGSHIKTEINKNTLFRNHPISSYPVYLCFLCLM